MLQYVNRARRTSDGVLVYWTTEDDPDPQLEASNAPSPANGYADPVVAASVRLGWIFAPLGLLAAAIVMAR